MTAPERDDLIERALKIHLHPRCDCGKARPQKYCSAVLAMTRGMADYADERLDQLGKHYGTGTHCTCIEQQIRALKSRPVEAEGRKRFGVHYDTIPYGNCPDPKRCDCQCPGCPGIRDEVRRRGGG